MVVLHPLVAIGTASHEAGQTSRVVLIWRQTEDLEALGGDFCTCIFVAIGGFCRPLIILGIGVVACNLHYTTLGHGLLVPSNLNGSHHGLTGKAEAAWRTVIEYIPLTVDFLNRAVGVMTSIGGDELSIAFASNHTTRVDQYAT